MWSHGFLGYDASFMLDFVVCALVLVVPVLAYSIYLVRYKQKFELHKKLQILLGVVLLVAVVAFEVDMRLHGGWKQIVNKTPEAPRLDTADLTQVGYVLAVHLVFAISTPIIWFVTTILALRRFPEPTAPGPHSRLHAILGWTSAVDLTLTSITGLYFYYVAFIASA